MPERARRSRIRYAAPKNRRLLDLLRRSGPENLATGGSGGNTIRDEIRFYKPEWPRRPEKKVEAFTQNS